MYVQICHVPRGTLYVQVLPAPSADRRLGDHIVRVLTMKEAITETRPLVLDALLKIPANFRVVTEWTPLAADKTRKEVNKRRRRELAAQYGHQADRVVAQAREHEKEQRQQHDYSPEQAAQRAVTGNQPLMPMLYAANCILSPRAPAGTPVATVKLWQRVVQAIRFHLAAADSIANADDNPCSQSIVYAGPCNTGGPAPAMRSNQGREGWMEKGCRPHTRQSRVSCIPEER